MTTLMNWRGLAVLALLCVLPRLSAVNIIPVSDGRVTTLTGHRNGNAISVQQTPTAPFAAFQSSVSAGGVTISQSSAISGNVVQAQGAFSTLYAGEQGDSVALTGSALFSITFQVSEPTPFFLHSFRDLGGAGMIDVTLSGPGTSIFWTGTTGTFFEPNDKTATGLLSAGTYTLSVDEQAGLFGIGRGMTGASGRYSLTFSIGVPDGGSAAAFGALAAFALIALRRLR